MTITAKKLYFPTTYNQSICNSEENEKEFFSMIRLNGRINKTTWEGRLSDVDKHLENYLSTTKLSPSQYLDVGVSSGIISWDWYQSLKQSGRPCKMVATDLIFRAFLVPVGPGLNVLSDRHGNALQYDFFGYGIRPGRPRPRDWVSGIVVISAIMSLAFRWRNRIFRRASNQASTCDFTSEIMRSSDIQEIQLISPRIKGANEIFFVEDDLFTPLPSEMKGRYDVIRIANVLNHDYFDVHSMQLICKRLKQCMAKSNSLLIVCRTKEDGSNHGTIFRLSDDGLLLPVSRIGAGSEIEDIVGQT